MADRKEGVAVKSIVSFSFYVYIPLFLRIMSLHIFCLTSETNIPFDLIKALTSICADCKTLHVGAAIFIS